MYIYVYTNIYFETNYINHVWYHLHFCSIFLFSDTPSDYYTVVYTDPGKTANVDSSLLSISSSSSSPSPAVDSNGNEISVLNAEPLLFKGTASSQLSNSVDSSSPNCICDNSKSQLSNLQSITSSSSFVPNKPMFNDKVIIFLITPTYTRPTQMPDMTRLAQTLRLVPNVFWIVVEDSQNKSK